ncbi:MAG: hypothetical protein E7478_00555 [Ruminococcaceae bacterium]|nr:hypothetical protein [Oscillospiraceae bacterium]
MIERIKNRLLHFETDGNVIPDFVAARLKKSARLRKVVHVCFYIQCVLSMACIIAGLILAGSVFGAVFSAAAGLLAIVVAFFALGGGGSEKTASYIMDMVYAVICFFIGGLGMYLCGGLMLAAALTALVSFFVDYFRRFLLEFSPLQLREEHYTLTGEIAVLPTLFKQEDDIPPMPEKSQLMEVAESFMEILK